MSIDPYEDSREKEKQILNAEYTSKYGFSYDEWLELQELKSIVEPYLKAKSSLNRYKELMKKVHKDWT